MFRSSTILGELVQSLAKVTFQLKHSVKLRRYISYGDVAACHGTACALNPVPRLRMCGAKPPFSICLL
jgi:hypothetical protein